MKSIRFLEIDRRSVLYPAREKTGLWRKITRFLIKFATALRRPNCTTLTAIANTI